MICKECRLEKKHHAKGLCHTCYGRQWDRQNYAKNKNNPEFMEKDRLRARKWRAKNLEKVRAHDKQWAKDNPDKVKAANRRYYLSHIEAEKSNAKRWTKNNPEKRKIIDHRNWNKNKIKYNAQKRLYNKLNKDKIYAKEKERIKTDLNYKLRRWISCRIGMAVRNQSSNKSYKTISLLGCTIPEFRSYIEKQFEPGMTWNNWSRKGWQLHHIIACAHFNLVEPEQQKLCFNFTNMKPLWWEDHIKIGCKIDEDLFLPDEDSST